MFTSPVDTKGSETVLDFVLQVIKLVLLFNLNMELRHEKTIQPEQASQPETVLAVCESVTPEKLCARPDARRDPAVNSDGVFPSP